MPLDKHDKSIPAGYINICKAPVRKTGLFQTAELHQNPYISFLDNRLKMPKGKISKDIMESISACVIIKDEELEMESLMENLKPICDEIVVIHDGPCKDKSLEIVRRYTDKIFVRDWVGQAESHRPFAFGKCRGDWILWIDADERMPADIIRLLPDLVKRRDVHSYGFLYPQFLGRKQITTGFWGRQYRKDVLFRKSMMLPYRGLPSETIRYKDGKDVLLPMWTIHHPRGEKFTWNSLSTESVRTANAHAKVFYAQKLNTKPRIFYFFKSFVWFFVYLFYSLIWNRAIFDGWENIQASVIAALGAFLCWWKVAFYRPPATDTKARN